MKVLVIAEKKDMGIKFAAAMGGINLNGKLISLADLDVGTNAKECQMLAGRQSHLVTQFEGNEYTFMWTDGHLLQQIDAYDLNEEYRFYNNIDILFDTSLDKDGRPIFDGRYLKPITYKGAKFKNFNDKNKRFIQNLTSALKNKYYDLVIAATDYGREGELIFKYIYDFALAKRGSNVPYKRAQIVENNEKEIRRKLTAELVSAEDNMPYELAAYARAHADAIIGKNLTAAATCSYQNPLRKTYKSGKTGPALLTLGRVQTPVLYMVALREKEIKNFKKKTRWKVKGIFKTPAGEYTGFLADKSTGEELVFDDINEAKAVAEEASQGQYRVAFYKEQLVKEGPPLLYDTSDFYMDADKQLNLTANTTLACLQGLYSNGFLTYPRTDSKYLPESKVDEMKQRIVELKACGSNYAKVIDSLGNNIVLRKRFFNDKKIDDHFAIIPTSKILNSRTIEYIDLTDIKKSFKGDDKEIKSILRNIYAMACKRVIAMAMPDREKMKIQVVTSNGKFLFKTTGSRVVKKGWTVLYPNMESDDFPKIEKGMMCNATFEISETSNQKPPHYTDGTLVKAMMNCGNTEKDENIKNALKETKGIGTGATRAATIEGLIQKGYIKRSKKNILITENGEKLIDFLPIENLKQPRLSAEWELALNDIANKPTGAEAMRAYTVFLDSIRTTTKDWIKILNPKYYERIQGGKNE